MSYQMKRTARPGVRRRAPRPWWSGHVPAIGSIALAAALSACGVKPESRSGDAGLVPLAASARSALPTAEAAARAWMRDARLVYIENDADLDAAGGASRWGFLFRSDLADSWRAVSIAGGAVVSSDPLAFPFAAPGLPADWIDSPDAVQRADLAGGSEFCVTHQAALAHVVLGRGIFTSWDGPPTWTVVYRAADRSELAIVVSGDDGSILSRFEG